MSDTPVRPGRVRHGGDHHVGAAREDGGVATYLAVMTVHGDLEPDEAEGMRDALGATGHIMGSGRVVLSVPGEAPDLATATAAARRHAAEVLDGYVVDVEVGEERDG
jgi:hypothetical protein